jgi:hypothetical protein
MNVRRCDPLVVAAWLRVLDVDELIAVIVVSLSGVFVGGLVGSAEIGIPVPVTD